MVIFKPADGIFKPINGIFKPTDGIFKPTLFFSFLWKHSTRL